jgi:hypothetical protein
MLEEMESAAKIVMLLLNFFIIYLPQIDHATLIAHQHCLHVVGFHRATHLTKQDQPSTCSSS